MLQTKRDLPKMTSDFQEIHLKSIVHLNSLGGVSGVPHRAMFKLGGKKIFVLCLLVKNVSAVYSADRCDFSMLNSSCYWISSGPHGS